MDSAEIARIRLLGIVQKDRETAPAYRWRRVRSACMFWFNHPQPVTVDEYLRARRQRKAKYRLERRT